METQIIGKHLEKAKTIAREVGEGGVLVAACARQGDLIVTKKGESEANTGKPFAALLADGVHGEHWVIAPKGGKLEGDTLDLPEGGVVVHTDKPAARHGALRLSPGAWKCDRLQELSIDGSVVRVED